MRELKFRAWNKRDNKMFSSIGVDDCGSPIIDTKAHQLYPIKGDSIIMQYTGLKDKNGKEIYEGDIINFPEKTRCYQDNPQNIDKSGINFRGTVANSNWWGIVEYLNDKEGVGTIGRFAVKGLMWKLEYCEVIGNIYENPELLK